MAQERQPAGRPEQGQAVRRAYSRRQALPRRCDGKWSLPDARWAIDWVTHPGGQGTLTQGQLETRAIQCRSHQAASRGARDHPGNSGVNWRRLASRRTANAIGDSYSGFDARRLGRY
jgi:hypothetical protein